MQINLSRKWSGRVTHQRFVMRDREREGEPRVAAPSRCRAAFTPCRSRGVFIRPRHRMSCARVLTTCSAHWGHLSPLYSCTVHCTVVQLSHQQHHYILSHRQSVSNSGSSQTLVTKCREILSSPVKNFDIIWLRSVLWPWMTLMKNFICGYLDSDNHHDIVSIFWLGKKSFGAWKKYFLAHRKTLEMGVQWSRHAVPATFWCGVGFHLTQCLSQSDPDTKLWCDEKISGW